jgi:glycosyltransferase involved in cell wall biosynthesis
MIRIAGTLVQAGFEVSIIGRSKNRSYNTDYQEFKIERFKCWFNKGFLFYKEYNLRLLFYLLFRKKYEIVCACDTDTLAGAALGGRLRGSKLVYDAHEWFTEVPELEGKAFKKAIWKLIENIYMGWTDLRYTVNVSLAKIFQDRFNKAFHTIRNLPIREEYKSSVKEEPPVILYQGALNKGRGLEESIDAIQFLPGFQLWLVGEGDLSMELRNRAKAAGLDAQVKFYGYQLPEELKTLTPVCFVGLNLLKGDSRNYFYSLANKFFDYLQAGLPSINMRFPEYEILEDQYSCSILVDECSPQAIVKAVKLLYDDKQLYQDKVNASLAAAKDLHWEKEAQKLIELYKVL